jgi:soluble lytic murein transglycosylase
LHIVIIPKKKIVKTAVILFLLGCIFAGLKFNLLGKIFYPYLYKETVERYASAYGVDPHLVIAVIREESHFIPKSSSHKGAVGLMQLMPATAEEIAGWLKEDYRQVNLELPEDNIRYGTWYLSALKKEFSDNTILVLAAYNAGSGRVKNWLRSSERDFNSYLIEDIPFPETRDYVLKVLNSYQKYSEIYPHKAKR